jgi:hypothetical protein
MRACLYCAWRGQQGLVTYREVAILIDPQSSSSANKQNVAVTVAHEVTKRLPHVNATLLRHLPCGRVACV